jgi:protein TonB
MKLLTVADRIAGIGMTGAVCAAVMPALLALGVSGGRVSDSSPSVLRTFNITLPQSRPDPEIPPQRAAPPEPGARAVAARPVPSLPAPAPGPAAQPEYPAAALPLPVAALPPPPVARPAAESALVPARPANAAPPSDYAARLWSHIAARRPAGIRLEGTTIVAFTLSRNGRVTELAVAEASGNAMLDRLALRSVRQASPLPPPPDALRDDQLRFTIPFSFR